MTPHSAENEPSPPDREITDLLPWYAAGTLSAADAARVDAALARDAGLQHQLEIIREELDETVLSNEHLAGAPPRALDTLLAAIDREPKRSKPASAGLLKLGRRLDLGGRLAQWLQPKTLAWASLAAALVIAVQAGFIVDLARKDAEGSYETASAPKAQTLEAGTNVMVGFQPEASAAAIDALLSEVGANIVEGPRAGLYRLRIGPAGLSRVQIERTLAVLRGKTDVIRFAGESR